MPECGPYASVLGRSTDQVVQTFLDGMKRRFPVADRDVRLSGCLVEFDALSGRAIAFERIELTQAEESKRSG